MKVKVDAADRLFSRYIRERDSWTCQRCHARHPVGSMGLHCSHYFGRGRESTRFDSANCDSLCYPCHMLWGHGDRRDEYRAFKVNQLGEAGFRELEIRANSYAKKDRKMAMLYVKELMKGTEGGGRMKRKPKPKGC